MVQKPRPRRLRPKHRQRTRPSLRQVSWERPPVGDCGQPPPTPPASGRNPARHVEHRTGRARVPGRPERLARETRHRVPAYPWGGRAGVSLARRSRTASGGGGRDNRPTPGSRTTIAQHRGPRPRSRVRWQPKFHELYIFDCRRRYSLFFIYCAAFRIAATILAADHTLLLHLLYSVLYAAGERGAALGRPGASGGAHRGELTPPSARCASGHRGPWLGLRS